MKEKKAPMILGIGAALAGVFLLLKKKKPPLPEPPPNSVVVGLLNPPKEAEDWSLSLTDWDITIPIREVFGGERRDIAFATTFDVPREAMFPLRIISLQITKWNPERTALIVLYEVQSFHPYLWDFDIMDWGDEPNPTYREAFIPDYGSYYYNVSKERFE